MKIFIFKSVDKLTPNFHKEGTLVIIADSLKRALELANSYRHPGHEGEQCIYLSESEIKNVIEYDILKPLESSNNQILVDTPNHEIEERVFVFPDLGHCQNNKVHFGFRAPPDDNI